MFDEIEEQVVDITGLQTITHVVTPVGSGSLCQAVRMFSEPYFLIARNFAGTCNDNPFPSGAQVCRLV